MSWADFLRWLSTPSAVTVVVGVLLSYLIEFWPQYEAMPARFKRLLFGGMCLAVPLLSALVGAATGVFTWTWEPTFWGALVAGFTAFASGTAAHTRKL